MSQKTLAVIEKNREDSGFILISSEDLFISQTHHTIWHEGQTRPKWGPGAFDIRNVAHWQNRVVKITHY